MSNCFIVTCRSAQTAGTGPIQRGFESLSERLVGTRAQIDGYTVGGKNGTDALNNAQELEDDCHLYFLTQGCRVRYLTDAEVSALRK